MSIHASTGSDTAYSLWIEELLMSAAIGAEKGRFSHHVISCDANRVSRDRSQHLRRLTRGNTASTRGNLQQLKQLRSAERSTVVSR